MASKFVRISELEETPAFSKRDFDPRAINPRDKYAHLRNTQSERSAYIDREERAAEQEYDRISDIERFSKSNRPARYEPQRSVVWEDDQRVDPRDMRYTEASTRAINRVGFGYDSEENSLRPDPRYASHESSNNRDSLYSYGGAGGGLGHIFEDELADVIKLEFLKDNDRRKAEFEQRDSRTKKLEAKQAWEARKLRQARPNPNERQRRLSDSRATAIVKIANEFDASDTDWMFYRDEILSAQEEKRMAARCRAKQERLSIKANPIEDADWDYQKRRDWEKDAASRLINGYSNDVNSMQSDIFQQEILKHLGRR